MTEFKVGDEVWVRGTIDTIDSKDDDRPYGINVPYGDHECEYENIWPHASALRPAPPEPAGGRPFRVRLVNYRDRWASAYYGLATDRSALIGSSTREAEAAEFPACLRQVFAAEPDHFEIVDEPEPAETDAERVVREMTEAIAAAKHGDAGAVARALADGLERIVALAVARAGKGGRGVSEPTRNWEEPWGDASPCWEEGEPALVSATISRLVGGTAYVEIEDRAGTSQVPTLISRLRRDHIEKLRDALSGAIAAMRAVQGRSNSIERGPEVVAGLSPAIKAAEKVLMESRPSTGESSS